jgi:hypothetical protein
MSAVPSRLEAATHFRLRSRRIVSTRNGYDAQSSYVEQFWLPVLGPSTILLIRHLNIRLERDGEGVILETALTARALGLGEHPGRRAPFLRAVRRAIDFDLISVGERDEKSPETEIPLLVRRLIPLLSKRLAERLPEPIAREHRCALTQSETEETPLARRARQLARTHQQLVAPPSNMAG